MKLTTLKPALSTLLPRVRVDRDARSDVEPGRKWYRTRRWRRLRLAVFVRDRFKCQWCPRVCSEHGLVAHHKIRHRGDMSLFFDINNLETVCKVCHDSIISSQERNNNVAGTWY